MGSIIEKEVSGAKLPPLPHVLVDLLKVCQDPSAGFQDMARVVASDAVLAAQVLAVANSSYYGRQGNARTIERALLLLGTDALKTIAITASVQQMCNGFAELQPDYRKSFWQRSLRCALIARALAHVTSYPAPDEAYLLGLLHNVGELVLAVNHPERYPGLCRSQEVGQLEAEETSFGTHHCELGRVLAEQWHLDSLAADAIEFHHAPLSQVVDAHHLTKLICLAARLAEEPAGVEGDEPVYADLAAIEAAERLFGMSGALAKEIAARVTREVARIAAALAIDLEDDAHADMAAAQARLGEQLQRRLVNQEMSALLPDPQQAGDLLEPDILARAVNLMFGYRQTLLLALDSAGENLEYDVPGSHGGAIRVNLGGSESLVARCANSGEVQWSQGGAGPGLTVVDRQLLRLCASRSLVCAAVRHAGRLLGVLVMGDSGGEPPDAASCALLQDFAAQLAARLAAAGDRADMVSADAQRLQARVRSVVHEVNNPLTIVRNYLQALASSAGEGGDARELKILREEIDRAGQILMRLQDVEVETEAGDGGSVNGEIRALVEVFQQSICQTNGVECKLELSPKLEASNLPRNPLRQIVTNLVKNAVEAMPDGGRVTVSTGLVISSARGQTLEIVIADSGPGLPQIILEHMFQPGHTTKAEGHSGLGLSITRSLVEELGGSISCQSGERGTQFRIALPLA